MYSRTLAAFNLLFVCTAFIVVCLFVQVNHKMEGKGALHVAAVHGYLSVIKTILQFDPDLEIKV